MLNTYLKDPQEPAQACVIWMHGLGADASDMGGLADHPAIAALPLRHVFIDAPVRPVTLNAGMPMRAWYDILGMKLTDREDKAGIKESEQHILDEINAQLQAGFRPEQIVLAGFSQGGAMALYTALHSEKTLGGVIAMSSYLPLALQCEAILAPETPFFLAAGKFDPMVLPEWSRLSQDWLIASGYKNITWREYPMEHNVCLEEIQDVAAWLSTHFITGAQGA
ncbi:alpha/beta hydrolase [Legionella sp. CNM-4043-24]|uniref:alpha/beta hydrolase n=1 Tax=Legionella sp. CNM-4043-24 TaxID=3421646 RepID=UPI00403AF5FA